MKLLKHSFLNFQFIFLLVVANFLMGCLSQKKPIPNKYEDFLTTVYERGQLNGNVLILENGAIAYKGSFGVGNIDPIDSLKLDSKFRLASVSKQFTAMGIMILKEKGKLSYDQDLRDFIPELPYEGITIRHLLHHVSGLPDYERLMNEHWKGELKFNDPERFVSGNNDVIEMLAEKRPEIVFNPKDKFEYSNTGYLLLASIIERVSGISFGQFLKDHVFDPVEMTNTSVYNYVPGYDRNTPLRVYGYRTALNGKDQISNDVHYINPVQGDGGIYSTLGDLLKWDRILYTDELVSKATLEEAFSPIVLNNGKPTNYGFGWFINTSLSNKKTVEHSGGWVGFRTYFYREIEENNCIIILTNNSTNYMRSILKPIKQILHDKPYTLPQINIDEVIGKVVVDQGIEVAITAYKEMKSEKPHYYNFDEYLLNNLGRQLTQINRNEEAIKIIQLNVEEFPESPWAYQYLGYAFLSNKDTTNAIENFKNALSIDSTMTGSKNEIEKIMNITSISIID